jgi:hypothetical protein
MDHVLSQKAYMLFYQRLQPRASILDLAERAVAARGETHKSAAAVCSLNGHAGPFSDM